MSGTARNRHLAEKYRARVRARERRPLSRLLCAAHERPRDNAIGGGEGAPRRFTLGLGLCGASPSSSRLRLFSSWYWYRRLRRRAEHIWVVTGCAHTGCAHTGCAHTVATQTAPRQAAPRQPVARALAASRGVTDATCLREGWMVFVGERETVYGCALGSDLSRSERCYVYIDGTVEDVTDSLADDGHPPPCTSDFGLKLRGRRQPSGPKLLGRRQPFGPQKRGRWPSTTRGGRPAPTASIKGRPLRSRCKTPPSTRWRERAR